MRISAPQFRSRPRRAIVASAVSVALAIGLVGVVAGPVWAALPAGPTTLGVTGSRPSATSLSFPISDQVSASVDVATGNLLVNTIGISLPGINASVPIGASYNSLSTSPGSASSPAAVGWSYNFDNAGSLSQVSAGVVFTAADGATWLFTPVSGSTTAFTSPPGLKKVLVASPSNYTLTDLVSRQQVTFDPNGNPQSVADRNGNLTSIGYPTGASGSVVSTAGPVPARTAAMTYTSATRTLAVTQTNGALTRTVAYVKNTGQQITSIVDANGKTTSFAYTGGKMTQITATTGAVTNITYDSSTGYVLQVDQLNTTAGSPGTSTTRLTYPSTSQTLVADPNTSTGTSVAAGPHTTYAIGSGDLVASSTDSIGRVRSATYSPLNLGVMTATAGTTAPGTTNVTYGANSGLSATKVASPGGANTQATYANTAPATQYLPDTTTDDNGQASTVTYNGAGNQMTSSSPLAAMASVGYNLPKGTIASATAPINAASGNKTIYHYNGNDQVDLITPPTGTTLGTKALTYDLLGRLSTQTDGNGITVTYTYDKIDRLLTTAFSSGVSTVTNTYDDAGRIKTRVDANGTTTWGYDQLGRLISRVNTAGGGTISYGYDKASNLITTTDSRGTTTNSYDTSEVATRVAYVKSGTTLFTNFATDDQGRRTDEWLQANSTNTTWAGHVHTTYDTSSRVVGLTADSGPATGPVPVLNMTYCYQKGTTAPNCTVGAGTDRSKLAWSKDNLSSQVTAYSYDNDGRIQTVAQSGSSSGNTTWNYTYDADGNRLTAVATGGSPSSQTLTYNAANQITSAGYSYDGAGNMTADPSGTYTYNAAEQMTQSVVAGVTSTYTYAGTSQNELLQETTSAGRTYKIAYGRTASTGEPVIEQYNVQGNQAYVDNDPETGQPLMLRTSSGIAALYVDDGIGNPVGLLTDFQTNAFMYAYDPYGGAVLTGGGSGLGTTQNPYLFKNGIQDRSTGFVKFGGRWYSPTAGRFTQQDTLDAPLDPSNGNRYAFAGDDPINSSDPSGLLSAECSQKATDLLYDLGIAGLGVVGAALTSETGVGLVIGLGVSALSISKAFFDYNYYLQECLP